MNFETFRQRLHRRLPRYLWLHLRHREISSSAPRLARSVSPLRQALLVFCVAIGSCAISACASTDSASTESARPAEDPRTTNVTGVGAFLARGSLFQTAEFEQYRLAGSMLFAECGTIRGSRPQVRSKHIFRLSTEERDALLGAGESVAEHLSSRGSSYPEGTKSLGFLDAGQAHISVTRANPLISQEDGTDLSPSTDGRARGPQVETLEVKTSLDEVASQPRNSPLRRLVVGLRGIARRHLTAPESLDAGGAVLCDNSSFYGID